MWKLQPRTDRHHQVMLGTCGGRQDRKGAWHMPVDTYVPVKAGFCHAFHVMLLLLALSLINCCVYYHFQTCFTKLKCSMCLGKFLSKKRDGEGGPWNISLLT